jgi:hypothetical protein
VCESVRKPFGLDSVHRESILTVAIRYGAKDARLFANAAAFWCHRCGWLGAETFVASEDSDDALERAGEDGVATAAFAATSLPNLVIDNGRSYVSTSGAARCTYRNVGGATYDGTLNVYLILYDSGTGAELVKKKSALSARTRKPGSSAWVGDVR